MRPSYIITTGGKAGRRSEQVSGSIRAQDGISLFWERCMSVQGSLRGIIRKLQSSSAAITASDDDVFVSDGRAIWCNVSADGSGADRWQWYYTGVKLPGYFRIYNDIYGVIGSSPYIQCALGFASQTYGMILGTAYAYATYRYVSSESSTLSGGQYGYLCSSGDSLTKEFYRAPTGSTFVLGWNEQAPLYLVLGVYLDAGNGAVSGSFKIDSLTAYNGSSIYEW